MAISFIPKIEPLGTNNIYSIKVSTMTTDEIIAKIDDVSDGLDDMQLHVLYTTVESPSQSQRMMKGKSYRSLSHRNSRADTWTTEAHIYGIKSDQSIASLAEVNE